MRKVALMTKPTRTTTDLSAYPDLVMIYLGMRVEEPRFPGAERAGVASG
jgi:hypothetical protein